MAPDSRWMLALCVVAPLLALVVGLLPLGGWAWEMGLGLAAAIWVGESWRFLALSWRALPPRPGFPGRVLPTDAIELRLLAGPAILIVITVAMGFGLLLGWRPG